MTLSTNTLLFELVSFIKKSYKLINFKLEYLKSLKLDF